MLNAHNNILKSKNVLDATDLISTHVFVTHENLPIEGNWVNLNFDEKNWLPIKIPYYRIVQNKEFKEGNFAYYRIKIPKSAFKKIDYLKKEASIVLQGIYFNQLDIVVNGRFFRTKKPKNSVEAKTIVPVLDGVDNIIGIKGYIKSGDTGIDSRNPIMLGRDSELDEIHRASYKGQVVFQLVFILCKGSILFIFALIYWLLKVDRSFEKFFIFGICAVIEELIAGDYLYGPLSFNQMVYLYDFVNFGAAVSVFLFFAELTDLKFNRRILKVSGFILLVTSFLLTADALYTNHFVDISKFMKCWNLVTVSILIFYIPKAFKTSLDLFIGLLFVSGLYLWGALFTANVGLNFKAYGNLILFFMVAYKTFAIFRREQEQLQLNERKLLEQEKDVAVGKTAALLAHDVRKPLEQIKLVFEKIRSGDANEEFLEIAKADIDLSIDSVSRQVNEIMNFSKITNVELRPVSFYKILRHSLKQVMSLHQEMDLDLSYKFDCYKLILAEESRLSAILINLISNAVEAIRDIGGNYNGKISFSTSVENNRLLFHIYNNGPQIPEDVVGKIFKPLFTHGKPGGTGLGLASVVKSMTEIQGTVGVRNVDNGVEFKLSFLLTSIDDDIDVNSFKISSRFYHYSFDDKRSSIKKALLRVFLLETNKEMINTIMSSLSKLQFDIEVVVADSIEVGKSSIANKRFDLYILNSDLQGREFQQDYLSFLKSEVLFYKNSTIPSLDKEYINDVYLRRLKVLLVDDTKLFRISWQNFHGDHNINCVSSPEDALKELANHDVSYDVVVLDFHFSNSSMDGLILGKKILSLRPGVKIFISSSLHQANETFLNISKRDFEIRKFL